MNCALCLREKTLRDSHLLPEFLYTPLYDEKHRFTQISTKGTTPLKLLQKGLRERLLCDECEQRLSRHESYARGVVERLVEQGGRGRVGSYVTVSQIDYTEFRLFLLSILWRCSVSRLQAFKEVRLGPHQEVLRSHILADDPGNVNAYGCVATVLTYEGDPLRDLITQPGLSRMNGHIAYRFVFSGLVMVYVVSTSPVIKAITEYFLQQDGSFRVRNRDIREMGFLMEVAKSAYDSGAV